MRGTFGKPTGMCARVSIGQVLLAAQANEALRRAKFKGFTNFSRDEYLKLRSEGRIVPDGSNAKVLQRPNPISSTYAFVVSH
ncbi:hypothetical protein PR202_gb13153 [Eleusine coracana subsp. coracana]|uniref:Uncharacterized protein n=1 Tax=Eleusine coracana subsp. coracana TaxID=191504 RepID=A0AAV5ERC5_ELECO|nr:hypothetical protein PR202_gb13153 [Eleusine coracana subsp. coracana]